MVGNAKEWSKEVLLYTNKILTEYMYMYQFLVQSNPITHLIFPRETDRVKSLFIVYPLQTASCACVYKKLWLNSRQDLTQCHDNLFNTNLPVLSGSIVDPLFLLTPSSVTASIWYLKNSPWLPVGVPEAWDHIIFNMVFKDLWKPSTLSWL